MIAMQAVCRARVLPHACNHAMILAAMASFYLSDPQASTPDARLAKKRVLASLGALATPTMAVLNARSAAGRLFAGTQAGEAPQASREAQQAT
jgi:hypothetical protein